jgi:lysozyme
MNDKRKIIAIFIIVAIVAALAAVATFFVIKSAKKEARHR